MHPHRLLAPHPALILTAVLASGAAARGEDPCRLTVVERSVAQDQGSWQVDYRLRFEGEAAMVVTPAEVLARVEGWVSNSRVASHALPRWSSVAVSGPSGLTASGDVITSADESQRCRERVVLRVCTCEEPEGPPDSIAKAAVTAEPPPSLSVAPGATVRARLRLEHLHFLHGDYDPLLGHRTLELQLGAATLRDVIPADCEQYLAQAKAHWPVPPEDRRDTRHYVSAPDSLHLEAHIPGNQYYRFPERPVRYATKMRLRFWYLIAEGTEGQCLARVAQYRDTPTAWKVLAEGAHEECLTTVGRWVKVERVLRTEPDATTLALDFRISNSDIGELWIDDVTLEPMVAAPVGP
jgi:hypothetical protein